MVLLALVARPVLLVQVVQLMLQVLAAPPVLSVIDVLSELLAQLAPQAQELPVPLVLMAWPDHPCRSHHHHPNDLGPQRVQVRRLSEACRYLDLWRSRRCHDLS